MRPVHFLIICIAFTAMACNGVKVKKADLPLLTASWETQKEKDIKEAIVSLRRVHFEYDSSTLSKTARVALADAATKLWRYEDVQLVVEGHADSRGTDEYNIALGEKRARAASAYLERMGMTKDQLTRISFGAEMPLADGESELAFAVNRRVDFQVLKGNVKLMLVDDHLVYIPLAKAHASR